jgi:DNA-binding HxlR family transcriptional regulator
MSDAEKLIITAAVVTLFGLVVWLVQANFNDLKKKLDGIADKMITRDVCTERHRPLTEARAQTASDIRRLYRLINGEPEGEDRNG